MHYTLNQLRIYTKVVELQSVTKASEVLHLTQPAVSIQLRKFQEQFEIPLTETVGRQLYVTNFGKEIDVIAREILSKVDEINTRAMAFKGLLTGKLTVSVVSTGKYVMPYFLTDFINSNPGVKLVMDVTNKATVIESLKENAVDFSLVSVMPDNLQVGKIDLIQNKLYLVGSPFRVAEKKKYTYRVFKEMPLIFREKGSGTRRTIEEFLQKNKLPMKVQMALTSNEAVKQAVIAGLGFAILPLIGIRNELMNGDLQIIPLRGFPIKSTWSMIWPEGKKHSPAAAAFIDYLHENKKQITRNWFEWYERDPLVGG